jgi:type VI secretion system secreted protein Hcp
MAFDAFIEIDGIEGESTDSKYSGWIEVVFFGANMSQTISSTASSAGGASAERVDFDQFTFTKLLDKASPKIALACAAGTHIDSIKIVLCRAGTEKIKFMEYRLTNCIISSITTTGGGQFPHETIGINFGKINWVYTQQNRKGGGAAGNIAAGWNLQRNCSA